MDPVSLSPARAAVVAAALEREGWTAPEPRYLDLVAPSDSPARQAQVATESDCERVAEGVLFAVFAFSDGPYADATAFPRLYALAGGFPWAPAGALRVPTIEAPPKPADVAIWGDSPDKQSPAHVEIVTAISVSPDGTTITLEVVAGGERDAEGHETIRKLKRVVVWMRGRWLHTTTGRPLIGLVDCDLFPFPLRAAPAPAEPTEPAYMPDAP